VCARVVDGEDLAGLSAEDGVWRSSIEPWRLPGSKSDERAGLVHGAPLYVQGLITRQVGVGRNRSA